MWYIFITSKIHLLNVASFNYHILSISRHESFLSDLMSCVAGDGWWWGREGRRSLWEGRSHSWGCLPSQVQKKDFQESTAGDEVRFLFLLNTCKISLNTCTISIKCQLSHSKQKSVNPDMMFILIVPFLLPPTVLLFLKLPLLLLLLLQQRGIWNSNSSNSLFKVRSSFYRYCREEGAAPLWLRPPGPGEGVGKCQHCGGSTMFELQLTPQLLLHLRVSGVQGVPLEFGTVAVFTCTASCWDDKDTVRQEALVVQCEVIWMSCLTTTAATTFTGHQVKVTQALETRWLSPHVSHHFVSTPRWTWIKDLI